MDGKYTGDPVKDPKIRHNRASNLYGENIRTKSGGKLGAHQGFDYEVPEGTDIMAVKDGTVVQSGDSESSYGQTVTIEHTNENGETVYSFYAHLSEPEAKEGSPVKEGEIIGKSGTTGNAKGMKGKDQHLHFELRTQKKGAKGLTGKRNPNEIVDTKFKSQNPDKRPQTTVGVIKITSDGKVEHLNID